MKAMTFMFAPTLSVLVIIFFWFFNLTDFVSFITSQSAGASTLRVLMMLLEVFFVCVLYKYYEEKEFKEQLYSKAPDVINKTKGIQCNANRELRYAMDGQYNDEYYIYNTAKPNIKIVEVKSK